MKRRLRRWLEPPEETFDPFDVSPRVLEQWLGRLRARGPDFFYGYTSVLTLLGLHLRNRGEILERVRGIGTTAEALLPHARTAFKEVFPRAAVIDIYGSREIPGVSAECRLGAMHINSDLVHVEFLADPLAQGGSRVVLTALDNRIFPFIRYDIGDEGSPPARPCPCGLPFPTMRFGPGRIVDFFVMPDGRVLYAGSLEELMYDVPDVHRYQFLQKTATEIVLSVIPDATFGATGREALDRARLKAIAILGPAVSLEVRLVDAIPLSRSGKHLYLVSLVRNPILGGTETATL